MVLELDCSNSLAYIGEKMLMSKASILLPFSSWDLHFISVITFHRINDDCLWYGIMYVFGLSHTKPNDLGGQQYMNKFAVEN